MDTSLKIDLNQIRRALAPLLAENGFVKCKSAFVEEIEGRRTTLRIRKVMPTFIDFEIRWEMDLEYGDQKYYPQFVQNLRNMPMMVVKGVTPLAEAVELLRNDFLRRVLPFLEDVKTIEEHVAMGRWSEKHVVAL